MYNHNAIKGLQINSSKKNVFLSTLKCKKFWMICYFMHVFIFYFSQLHELLWRSRKYLERVIQFFSSFLIFFPFFKKRKRKKKRFYLNFEKFQWKVPQPKKTVILFIVHVYLKLIFVILKYSSQLYEANYTQIPMEWNEKSESCSQ